MLGGKGGGMMTLGQRIAQYRKAMGISQEELGGRLGVSRQAVSKWETDAARRTWRICWLWPESLA